MTAPRYTFPCGRGEHQVAVDPARYWLPARCPRCRAPVDRWRLRRLRRWLRGEAPWSRVRLGRLGVLAPAEGIAGLVLLATAAVAALFATAGDTGFLGTVLVYSGRWIWLVPVLGAVPLALLRARAALLLAAALLLVLGPIMGGTLGLPGLWRRARLGGAEARVRVLTYNVAGGDLVALRLDELMAEASPDIAVFQECGAPFGVALQRLEGYHVVTDSSCIASRHPIAAIASMASADIQAAGGAGNAVRHRIELPTGPITVTNVHLQTPRWGLQFMFSDPAAAPHAIAENREIRAIESRVARRWVDSTAGARIIAGDFNLPMDSRIYRTSWGGFEEAFDAAGFGFGYTRLNGWIRVRIDHVLTDGAWRSVRAEVLPDYGSDHLPLLAELVRP